MSAVLERDDGQDVAARDVSLDRLVGIASRVLGPEYSSFRFFESPGSARVCLLADWKPLGLNVKPRTRIVKIDRETFSSDNAGRVVGKGYTTRNDVEQLLAIPDPESHHIVQSLGYVDLCDHGWDGALSVENYFPSLTLEQYVKQESSHGSQNAVAGVRRVFSQVLAAERYLIRENGILHRDLKPSNILVNDDLEVRLTDLANGGSTDDIVSSCDPTYGGHLTADPRLMMLPSGVEAAYDEQSEIHSLGKTLLFALSGRNAVEYDKNARTAVRLDTSASILDDDGQLSISLHDAAVADACRELRGDAKKYSRIIQRSTTLDRKKQYQTIDELINDFEAVGKPGLLDRVMTAWRPIAAAALLTATLAGIGGVRYHNAQQQILTQSVEEASKPAVIVRWTDRLEVRNSLANLEFDVHNTTARIRESPPGRTTMEMLRSQKQAAYPQSPYIRGVADDVISVSGFARMEAIETDGQVMIFPGKAYIEGYESKALTIMNLALRAHESYEEWGPEAARTEIKIPHDRKRGMYILAIEMYSPEMGSQGFMRDYKFPSAGTVIGRKRIPIVVGSCEDSFDIRDITLRSSTYVSIYNACDDYSYSLDPKLRFEVRMPEDGLKEDFRTYDNSNISSSFNGPFRLPEFKDEKERTLMFVARRDSEVAGVTFFPVRHYNLYDAYYRWELDAQFDSGFSERIKAYREQLFKERR